MDSDLDSERGPEEVAVMVEGLVGKVHIGADDAEMGEQHPEDRELVVRHTVIGMLDVVAEARHQLENRARASTRSEAETVGGEEDMIGDGRLWD